ncbi:NAD(P)H dehydrogenase (quinone) [Rhodococcus sp. AG1013]|uniref:SDR family oxidoreductase n=1 Tax=Rhodococcus sp. AG1013 TaxID=2183996 RepID=UPI000E0BA7D4|nr:SDR family oxidoreductase [Rhodococcus sp. AG1013]RDI33690.1 NAD(P)H dehydrogenase (quinone) [Rhodococcus sp. AG1013]
MTIAVTGATGHLGRLTIDALLRRSVPASDVVAVVRNPAKAAELAGQGVQVRTADYADRAALETALAGVDKLLLISGSEVGSRVPQHINIIDAAKAAGVGLVAYTSIPDAPNNTLQLAQEHQVTERLLAESGLNHVLLRNGWYWENYTNDLAGTAERGVLAGSAGDGRVAGAARADYADAAAAVLTSDENQAGKVYELGGDEHLTYPELARAISDVTGKPVEYRDLPVEQYRGILESAGLPAPVAAVLADADAGVATGVLDVTGGDLQRLIGRASTPLETVLRAAL